MAERFEVSPEYIIMYLKDIERKLMRTNSEQFRLPHYTGGEISVEALNFEAKKMMEFVGLASFTPDCCWEEINNNTAGYIELDGSRFGPVKIHLSTRYKCNGHAVMAILAHEICHKLLEYHGLYFPALTPLNETYTDLCTIYVGFTQLIVNGCNTTVGNVSFTLGYLTKETFEKTITLVELVQGRKAIDKQWVEGSDVYSHLVRWIMNPDKRKCHIDGFAKRQLPYAALNKRISVLKQLLGKIPAAYNPTLKEIDLKYFFDNPSYGRDNTVATMPFTLFYMSHPEFFKQPDEQNAGEAARLSVKLDRMIRSIAGDLALGEPDLQINIHACPFCMREIAIEDDGRKWRVIKCKKCGNRFALDLSRYQMFREARSASPAPQPQKKWWQFWK